MTTKYSFIPAGLNYRSQGAVNIYIRYRNGHGKFGVRHSSPDAIWIDTPDRELVLTSHKSTFYPSQGSFDELVTVSPFSSATNADIGLDSFMVNYVDAINKEHMSHKTRKNGTPAPKLGPKIVADSGGFQLGMQRVDFINPYHYIEWCNDNADLVMALDYPFLSPIFDGPQFEVAARTHAANNRILLDNKREDIELINIFHGWDIDSTNRYRDIVETPEIDRLAIGGMYSGLSTASVDRFINILRGGPQYKHFHLLGVANVMQLIPLMKVAIHEKLPLLTSDSSTHLQKGVNKDYFHFTTLSEPQRILHFNVPEVPSAYKILPCSCIVCSALKYSDIFNLLDGSIVLQLMSYHSMFNIVSYVNTIFNTVSKVDTKELKEILGQHFRAKKAKFAITELRSTLDFIDRVYADGYDTAAKAFKYYLSPGLDLDSTPKSLLIGDDDEDSAGEADGQLATDDELHVQRILAHLQGFIDKCALVTKESSMLETKQKNARNNAASAESLLSKDKVKHPGHSAKHKKLNTGSGAATKAKAKAKKATDAELKAKIRDDKEAAAALVLHKERMRLKAEKDAARALREQSKPKSKPKSKPVKTPVTMVVI